MSSGLILGMNRYNNRPTVNVLIEYEQITQSNKFRFSAKYLNFVFELWI